MKKEESRFKGTISEDYMLLKLALPHFEELQSQVGKVVASYKAQQNDSKVRVIEIGCGNGATSYAILNSRQDHYLVCIDNEEDMVRQAEENLLDAIAANQCQLIQCDALDFCKQQETSSTSIVASALTLHNMERTYRDDLHEEIFRILEPGGVFVNADKYAPQDDVQRFQALGTALDRFFTAFVPLGKIDLLKEWVLHNVIDQSPDRCMKEGDTVRILRSIGFENIEIVYRENMEAVLTATKLLSN